MCLHPVTGVDSTGEYLSPKIDKQVGLGMLGLATSENLQYYIQTIREALDQFHNGDVVRTPAFLLVEQFWHGITIAAKIADANGMKRAFAIAPTASCSYRSKDLDGFTCALRSHLQSHTVDRDSGTFGVQSYNYGDVELLQKLVGTCMSK